MKKKSQLYIFEVLLIVFSACAPLSTTKQPIINPSLLRKTTNTNDHFDEKNILQKKATNLLEKEFKPITNKKFLPPSGNKNDYFSTAVYYWKNPNTKDGLPWIYKDGEYNGQALKKTDHSNYYSTMEAIRDLSLTYKLTDDIKFAKKAISLIEMWFINNQTKMNPHLNYAQGIPGVSMGYASGIIDSRAILWIINSIPILEKSVYWTDVNNNKFKEWCSDFLDWLLESKFGIKESKSKNNHGTFYDLQVATFATFVENYDLAKNTLENVKEKRIEIQIRPDGSMPEELKRTRAFMYSTFNLSAYFHSAILAEQYDLDLWNYKTKTCGSIREAFDFVLNNAIITNDWNYKGKINKSRIVGLLQIAGEYIDTTYLDIQKEVLKNNKLKSISEFYYVN